MKITYPLTIFKKNAILDVWLSSKYASEHCRVRYKMILTPLGILSGIYQSEKNLLLIAYLLTYLQSYLITYLVIPCVRGC